MSLCAKRLAGASGPRNDIQPVALDNEPPAAFSLPKTKFDQLANHGLDPW